MNFPLLLKSNKKISLVFFLFVVFLISFVFYFVEHNGKKYSFVFEIAGSADNIYEFRRVPSAKGDARIQTYVEELLLGPTVQRGKTVFKLGTRVLFCFIRGNVLYLNLSEDAVYNLSADEKLEESYHLLCRNVKANFPSISDVILFIDGNSVFADGKNR